MLLIIFCHNQQSSTPIAHLRTAFLNVLPQAYFYSIPLFLNSYLKLFEGKFVYQNFTLAVDLKKAVAIGTNF